MSDKDKDDHLVDQSDSFFGEPALLKGEDKTENLKLLTAVAQYIQPEKVFDWMMVNDTTNNYQEEMRFRRISAALIEGAKPEALEALLRPLCTAYFNEGPSDVARDYFSGDSKTKKEAALSVAHYGITPEMIEAKATQLVIGPLLVLDRMSGNREKSRRIHRKEHELRRRERERRSTSNDNAATRGSDGQKKAEG
jgi:hypothetical protein